MSETEKIEPPKIRLKSKNDTLVRTLNTVTTVPGAANPFVIVQLHQKRARQLAGEKI